MTEEEKETLADTMIDEGCNTLLVEAIVSLAAQGKIYDSGERRNGQIIWKAVGTKH